MATQNFLIPLVLDYTAKAYIYGETGPNLLFQYQFNDISGVITLDQMRNTFKYKDSDNGILLKYDITNGIKDHEWHNLITNQILTTNNKYRNSYSIPTDGPLSNHIIQWISSTLFGHPQAQAPLTNEEQIIQDVSNGTLAGQTLGQQIYNALTQDISSNSGGTNEIVQSIYEQMVNLGRFNVGSGEDTSGNSIPDIEGFVELPFKSGDKLSFLIKINCDLVNDTNDSSTTNWETSTSTNLSTLFGEINGVSTTDGVKLVPEVWKFTFVTN
jgi:hypothetical protein